MALPEIKKIALSPWNSRHNTASWKSREDQVGEQCDPYL